VKVIPKENGMVAVVIMQGDQIVKGLAEIRPPRGMTADEAAMQISVSRGGPKIKIIVPPGWGRQATNPKAKDLRVIDTNVESQEEEAARAEEKVSRLRGEYDQYRAELYGRYGVGVHPSHDSVDTMLADKGFLEWRQRRQTQRDYQDFARKSRAMGWDDPESTKEAWKTYRRDSLAGEQKDERELQALKYDTANALKQNFGEPLLLGWMASKPKPVATQGPDGASANQYRVPLPDGSYATLSEAEFNKLKAEAWRKVETKLNATQNQKDRWQYQRDNRHWAVRMLDAAYGAKLEGRTYKDVDEAVRAGKDALKKGDLQASLESLAAAEQGAHVATAEGERYTHNQEVGAEVTITGLEIVKGTADIALAIGTAPMGGWGLVLVTGKGVTETLVVNAAKSTGEKVDWGDVAFEVSTQVVTAAVMHGVGKMAPNSAFMNSIRKVIDTPVAGDALQAIVIDSAAYAVKMEYEKARGRGEHWSPADAKKHFLKFVSDPSGLAEQVITATAARYLGPKIAARFPGKPAKGQAGPAQEHAAAPEKAATPPELQEGRATQQREPAPTVPAGEGPQPPAHPEPLGQGEPHLNVELSAPEAQAAGTEKPQPEPVKKQGAGGHEVEVTPESTTVCSPRPCPNLAVEYFKELKTDKRLVRELKEIVKLRKKQPGAAAERAAALQAKLEQLRVRSQLPAPANRLDPAIGQEGAARLDAKGEPFELGVGKDRAEAIQAGDKDFVLDKRITFDIDEPLPVGDDSIKAQRAVARALDPYNRQLLDPATNRATKGLRVDPRDIQRGRNPLPEVSLKQDPNALFTRRFGEVTELKAVFDQAVASIKEPGKMKPTALKNEINSRMRDIIKTAKSGPGKTVRDVLRANGFRYGRNVGFHARDTAQSLLPESTDAPGAAGVTSTMTIPDSPAPPQRIATPEPPKGRFAEAAGPQSERDALSALEAQAEVEAADADAAAKPQKATLKGDTP
jgi:hypothetical protein